jgi:hypothetical protein
MLACSDSPGVGKADHCEFASKIDGKVSEFVNRTIFFS